MILIYKVILTAGLDEEPNIRDVLLYSSHPDPQLRGHTTLIIGSFINTVLIEGRGDFAKWLQQNNSASNGKTFIYKTFVYKKIFFKNSSKNLDPS